MADFYQDLRENTVATLIGERGKGLILREKGVGESFDEATGFFVSDGTDVDHSVYGAVFDIEQTEASGTSVHTGQKKILLSPLVPGQTSEIVEPTTEMTLLEDSEEYTITKVQSVAPGGTVVLYKVWVAT